MVHTDNRSLPNLPAEERGPTGNAKVDGVVAVPRVGMIMEYILKVCVEGPT